MERVPASRLQRGSGSAMPANHVVSVRPVAAGSARSAITAVVLISPVNILRGSGIEKRGEDRCALKFSKKKKSLADRPRSFQEMADRLKGCEELLRDLQGRAGLADAERISRLLDQTDVSQHEASGCRHVRAAER